MAKHKSTFRKRLRKFLFRKAAEGGAWSSFYYFISDDSFYRETFAVAAGIARYKKDHESDQKSYFLLRRNIHRLEKGLLMRPRKAVFAEQFINETVSIYKRACQVWAALGEESVELQWASDVLSEYFSVVDKTNENVADAYRTYLQTRNSKSQEQPDRLAIPSRRSLDEPIPNYDAFMSLCRRRRSVRWYLDKEVPRELVNKAILAAAQAPSSCNRQPFVFRIFNDKDRARDITAIPLGTKGFAEYVPAVAVLVGRLRAYPSERDRHGIYVDGALAAMSFMFALETLGLASCPINWPDIEPQESLISEKLKLAADERVIMLISFGWADPLGMVAHSQKKELNELRVFE